MAGSLIENGKEIPWAGVRARSLLQGEVPYPEGYIRFTVLIFSWNETESDICAELELDPEAKAGIYLTVGVKM